MVYDARAASNAAMIQTKDAAGSLYAHFSADEAN
jgi:hypothetical protein